MEGSGNIMKKFPMMEGQRSANAVPITRNTYTTSVIRLQKAEEALYTDYGLNTNEEGTARSQDGRY